MIERIAILGTGLLGTSVGLALRAAGFKGTITGWNRSAEGAQIAFKLAPSIRLRPIRSLRRAKPGDLLSVPIYATLDLMEQVTMLRPRPSRHRRGQHQAADHQSCDRVLQPGGRAAFLPGHPMAGKERGGAALGDANLFRGAVWLFTDAPDAVRTHRGSRTHPELARMGGRDGLAKSSISMPRATTNWSPGSAICRSSWRRR